jgi:hypothetical protein
MSVSSENLQQAWQRQALDAPRITLAYIRHRTQSFQRRIRIRNGFEYVGGIAAIVLLLSRWSYIQSRPLTFTAVALWVLAMIYIMVQWHRRAAAQAPAEQLGTLDALQFYRQQLVRQRDAVQGHLRRWLPAMAPGLGMTFVALILEFQPIPWTRILAFAAWIGFGLIMAVVNSARRARGFQQEIDALDSMSSKS